MSLGPCTPVPDLGGTYGAFLLAVVISSMFYGMSIIQIVFYFQRFSKDPWSIKFYAALIWTFDTVSSILEIQSMYYYLITQFGNAAAGADQTLPLSMESFFAYSTMFIAQSFFVSRIWKISYKTQRWIPALIGLFALGAFGTGMATFGSVFINPAWSLNTVGWFKALATANKVLEFIADAGITIALTVLLHKRKSPFPETNSMLNRLIIFAVNRGAVAALLQVLYLMAFLAWPTELIWGVFHVLVGKVYTNSVLAALNSRMPLRGVGTDVELINATSFKFNTASGQMSDTAHGSNRIVIQKEIIQSTTEDGTSINGSRRVQATRGEDEDESVFHMKLGDSPGTATV